MAAHQLHFTSLCLCVSASLREPHLFSLAKAQKRKGEYSSFALLSAINLNNLFLPDLMGLKQKKVAPEPEQPFR